jgi:hypothetical protein
MASARQIAANRRNGAKGGPKTPEGRAAVRFNALRHGLAANSVILPEEDSAEFEELHALLKHDLAPANPMEDALADQIIVSYWRILRARGIERAMLTHHRQTRQHLDPDAAVVQAFIKKDKAGISFQSYFRYDSKIERAYYTALDSLYRRQSLRMKQNRDREGAKLSENGIRSVPSIQKKISVGQASPAGHEDSLSRTPLPHQRTRSEPRRCRHRHVDRLPHRTAKMPIRRGVAFPDYF